MLIKLIFARYYYNDDTDETIETADKIILEVENSPFITERVSKYLNELKKNRDNYIYNNDGKKRKLKR